MLQIVLGTTSYQGVERVGFLVCDQLSTPGVRKYFFPYVEHLEAEPSDICIEFYLPQNKFPSEKMTDYTYVFAYHKPQTYSFHVVEVQPVIKRDRSNRFIGRLLIPGILEYMTDWSIDEEYGSDIYGVFLFIIDEQNNDLPAISLYDENDCLVSEGGWVCWSAGTLWYDANTVAHMEELKQQIKDVQTEK